MHCDIALLPPCWLSDSFVGFGANREETSETTVRPARHTRQRSASCATAFWHRPMPLCCQHIQLQGAVWHVQQSANKEDTHEMYTAIICVPEALETLWRLHTCKPLWIHSLLKQWRTKPVCLNLKRSTLKTADFQLLRIRWASPHSATSGTSGLQGLWRFDLLWQPVA